MNWASSPAASSFFTPASSDWIAVCSWCEGESSSIPALFFGAATALQFRLQARGAELPYPALLMLPYLVTLAVLALATGRAAAPADLGRPYRREEV